MFCDLIFGLDFRICEKLHSNYRVSESVNLFGTR